MSEVISDDLHEQFDKVMDYLDGHGRQMVESIVTRVIKFKRRLEDEVGRDPRFGGVHLIETHSTNGILRDWDRDDEMLSDVVGISIFKEGCERTGVLIERLPSVMLTYVRAACIDVIGKVVATIRILANPANVVMC